VALRAGGTRGRGVQISPTDRRCRNRQAFPPSAYRHDCLPAMHAHAVKAARLATKIAFYRRGVRNVSALYAAQDRTPVYPRVHPTALLRRAVTAFLRRKV